MSNYTKLTKADFEVIADDQVPMPDDESRSSATQQTYNVNGVMLKIITHYYRRSETQYYIQDINE